MKRMILQFIVVASGVRSFIDKKTGLPWGRNFYPDTHPIPIPMGIPMGVPIPTADLQKRSDNTVISYLAMGNYENFNHTIP